MAVSPSSTTFRELRNYPQTMLFLLAYLFFNDGIQTVIGNSSLYGQEELGFDQSTVLGVFLFVQFVAFFGRVPSAPWRPGSGLADGALRHRPLDGRRRHRVLRPRASS